MALTPLPIDSVLPDVVRALTSTRRLVLEAPPGAGKTTRVPRALYDAGVAGEIVVVQPRRLAARLAARRVAEELGERAGARVGYQVRFENVTSKATRIVFVTEGVLLQRVREDPSLPGVGAVLLDEFHERHLATDLLLGLLRERGDLMVAAMSATLESAPVARYLDAPVVSAEGRRFAVEIDHLALPSERPLEKEVARAVKQVLAVEKSGDVLVFLPGAAEIRRAQAALHGGLDAEVVMLHGDLSPEEQDRAVAPGRRRKVILSTNVAETSVTIEGVVAVVDSGLHRQASHSPWSGLPTLRVRPISRASATQRAGRAGRVREGRCLRLYTRHDHDARPMNEAPEVARLDLAEPLLLLASLGIDAERFAWFEAPPPAALGAARELLARLGALDGDRVTALGRRLLAMPLHPRLGRIVVEAEARGAGPEGCLLAALLADWRGPGNVLAAMDKFDARAQPMVERSRRQLRQFVAPSPAKPGAKKTTGAEVDQALGMALLAGYPDRVARRRKNTKELVLSAGGSALVEDGTIAREIELMVTVDAEDRPGERGVLVRAASPIEPEWLVELHAERVRDERVLEWNAEAERVEEIERTLYDALVLEERRRPPKDEEGAARVLAEAALQKGASHFVDGDALKHLMGRVAFVRENFPESELPALDVAAALRALAVGKASFAELRKADLVEAVLQSLDGKRRRALEELAPARVTLPGGRAVRVHYEAGRPPWIESRLQDFFGMTNGPSVGRGRVPLTLHLLAPNQRAVQVTADLAGFWERHYPSVRRELCRRYPKHAWPEDPWAASPPRPRR